MKGGGGAGAGLGASFTQDVPSWADPAAADAAVDVREFSDYVFKQGADHGKDAVFRSHGYSKDDRQALAEEFQSQGAEQYQQGNYTPRKLDEHGQRVTIPIRLQGQGLATGRSSVITTGRMVEANGPIRLITPLAGFVK